MAKQQPAVESVKDETTETTETKTAKAEAKQRKMLTPAERVAKLEAELKAAREKAEAKAKVTIDALLGKRASLIEQINERKTKVESIEAELKELGHVIDDHSTEG